MHHPNRKKAARRGFPFTALSVAGAILAGSSLGIWSASQGSLSDLEREVRDLLSQIPAMVATPVVQTEPLPNDLSTLELDAAVARLGAMQAELERLNALGEQLVDISGLDAKEFDFKAPPPQGGPATGSVLDYSVDELIAELTSVAALIEDRSDKLNELREVFAKPKAPSPSSALTWPVRSGYITSRYGYRIHPIRKVRQFHSGVDLAGKRGSPVLAVADGKVIFSGWRNGYGRVVDLRHADGTMTRYAHNDANLVEVGDRVRRGQRIANIGSSGMATGPHLHFEVQRDGKTLDPLKYLASAQRPATLMASRN